MKLVCERAKLDEALKAVVARTKGMDTKFPILAHVMLSAGNTSLKCSATDLDTYSEATLDADVEERGLAVASADRLARLVASLPTGAQVHLGSDNRELTVKCGRSIYRLPTMAPADFPEFPAVKDESEFTLPAVTIKRLLGIPAVAAETGKGARQYLSGCFLHQPQPGQIVAVATNGHALVRVALSVEFEFPSRPEYIIPSEAISEITRIADGDVRVAVGSNLIEVKSGNTVFRSKLLDATYPDYQRVIPSADGPAITVDRADLIVACKRLRLLADGNPVYRIAWKAGDSEIAISLHGQGDGAEIIPAQIGHSDDGCIGFTPSVILPALDILEGETIDLHITGPSDACRVVDGKSADITAVIMPHRLPA